MGIFKSAIDSIYRTLIATNARIQGTDTDVRVIDKTDGTDAPAGPRVDARVKRPTALPSCTIRNSEVAERGLTIPALVGKSITFNGSTWYIHATEPISRPDGAGETRLTLRSTR